MDKREIMSQREMRHELLLRARHCWDSMETFRAERERCKRFTYGDQWSDMMPTPQGMKREEDYIREQGNIPLKNNLIRRLVRNVLGVFRNQWKIPQCIARDPQEQPLADLMQKLIEYNMELNHAEEIYARTMEEFLISGMAVHRKWFGMKERRIDCWTDFVNPENFFVDSHSRDFRGWDMNVIGELHDLDFQRLLALFGVNERRVAMLREIYDPLKGSAAQPAFGYDDGQTLNFSVPASPGLCRVVEVWTREYILRYRCHDELRGEYFKIEAQDFERVVERENKRRMRVFGEEARLIHATKFFDEEWRFAFLAPDGTLLSEGVSPYSHGSHPYVFKAYPFIDGEVHSFVNDIIDQQKFTNRLISMYDWILRSSAKGVLLFPEGALPEGVEISDIAEEWSRFNGVIVYRPRTGAPLPQQVSSNSTNIGITELLDIQMKMMEDISGVNGALQGKLESGTVSGALYDSQIRSSMTALADLLRSYSDFILDCTSADASNIRQFYNEGRLAAIAGRGASLSDTRTFFMNSFDFSIRG